MGGTGCVRNLKKYDKEKVVQAEVKGPENLKNEYGNDQWAIRIDKFLRNRISKDE